MAAFGHARSYRFAKADGAGGRLRLLRHKDLEDVAPVSMHIGIDGLMMIIRSWIDNKAVVGMDVSSFVRSVIPRADAPGRISTRITKMTSEIPLQKIRRRGHGVVHEVSNGGLAFATSIRTRNGLHVKGKRGCERRTDMRAFYLRIPPWHPHPPRLCSALSLCVACEMLGCSVEQRKTLMTPPPQSFQNRHSDAGRGCLQAMQNPPGFAEVGPE